MPDNSGNLRKQEILIPAETTRVQRYDYDSLNRLASAIEAMSGNSNVKCTDSCQANLEGANVTGVSFAGSFSYGYELKDGDTP